jgi:transposase
MADDDPLRLRLFILAVRSLDDDSAQRGSRRTREGRTPAVRQQMLAERLGIPQPDISRWERYWQERDWRRLLSLHSSQILTHELQEQIIETWAHHPPWTSEEVYRLLVGQGIAVTQSQVAQAAHESGWQIVRQTLGRLCAQRAETLPVYEDWLVGDLLAQNQMLPGKVEGKQGLTPQETLDVAAWQAAASAAGLQPRLPTAVQPWLRRVEQVLFQPWAEMMVGDVRCTYCGSADVGRKSRIPRFKRVVDGAGEVQTVAVYRYYCHNPACEKKSFTAFPPGVLSYTAERLETHVLVLQMYAWGRSCCRWRRCLGWCGRVGWWVSTRNGSWCPRTARLRGRIGAACTSIWRLTATPMTCCTSPSTSATRKRVRGPFCWRCAQRDTSRGWW